MLGWHGVKLGDTCSTYKFGNTIDQDLQVTEGFLWGVFRASAEKNVLLWKRSTEAAALKMSCSKTQQGLHKVSTTFEKSVKIK